MFGFALPIAMLIGLGVFSYETSRQQFEAANLVEQTHLVRTGLSDVLSSIKDAETGQRGFVLTGREEFLEPYTQARNVLDEQLENLHKQTTDNPHQQRRFKDLQQLVQDKLTRLAKGVEIRRRDGLEVASKVIAEGIGQQLMDDIRRVGDEMAAEEEALLQQREIAAMQASTRLTFALIGGISGTILLVLLVVLVLTREIDQQIGATIQHLLSASTELQVAATQQANGAKGQVTAATDVATTMLEMVATSRQIAASAQQVTRIAGDTAAATRSGDQAVQEAQRAAELVKHHVDRIVQHMLELGKRSQDIGGILEVINELSEQTNILAINATIEAAGAGESGRRFAVVADEIRKLADRVAGSTKDVRSLIEEVRAAASTAVMTTEDGAKAADACLRQFGDMISSFQRITDSASNTAMASREIEVSTKQQTTAIEQVSTAINEVAQTARETNASSVQTLETAAQLAGAAKQLAQMIRRESPAMALPTPTIA